MTPPAKFVPRTTFLFPGRVPSWYAGHMHSFLRSMRSLLPDISLVIEVRDARLPLTSINPVFEQTLHEVGWTDDRGRIIPGRGRERLVVYAKRDLVDKRIEEPLQTALAAHARQSVTFINTHSDRDVKRVWRWAVQHARALASQRSAASRPSPLRAESGSSPSEISATGPDATPSSSSAPLRGIVKANKGRKKKGKRIEGNTTTPQDAVRVLIVGMPNVGKSSLLNSLRRVGVGKGKAATTAPHPGETKKLTGTVRITRPPPPSPSLSNADESGDSAGASQAELLWTSQRHVNTNNPGIYVYDTPGVMVPFLGNGDWGGERAMRLGVTAGIKESLFDIQSLADYLLFRLNLRYAFELREWEKERLGDANSQLPSSVQEQEKMPIKELPPPKPTYLSVLLSSSSPSTASAATTSPLGSPARIGPTNSITSILAALAPRAPGAVLKGGQLDLDAAARLFVAKWREGKMRGTGTGELDLGWGEYRFDREDGSGVREDGSRSAEGGRGGTEGRTALQEHVDRVVARHFHRGTLNADAVAHLDGMTMPSRMANGQQGEGGELGPLTSKTQMRKQDKAERLRMRLEKLRAKGIDVDGSGKSKGKGKGNGKGRPGRARSRVSRRKR